MRLILLAFFSIFAMTATAQSATSYNQKMMADTLLDLSTMEASPHEIAFTQVLSEICPPFLNAPQKRKFQESYQKQLRVLIPEFDPITVITQINRQKEYHTTLKSVRAWTMSYPAEENKALCIEFAETAIY